VLPKADRHRAIAVAAYYRAERRGFLAGGDLADWLAAEREVDGWSDEHS
jgi:enoyl-CoA hydratase/carnithine racemase